MSTEVVARRDTAGEPRAEDEVRSDLGMVQVLSRLALSAGMLAVAGVSGWLASFLSRESVFLLGLIVPAIDPSSRTSIFALLNEGIDPRTPTIVATAPRRPARCSFTISS